MQPEFDIREVTSHSDKQSKHKQKQPARVRTESSTAMALTWRLYEKQY